MSTERAAAKARVVALRPERRAARNALFFVLTHVRTYGYARAAARTRRRAKVAIGAGGAFLTAVQVSEPGGTHQLWAVPLVTGIALVVLGVLDWAVTTQAREEAERREARRARYAEEARAEWADVTRRG